jgi:pyruvate formate lyase activating enzyme
VAACPQQAISFREETSTVTTDRSRCIACGECTRACPNNARELSGRWYTVEALCEAVEKDAAFYRRSRGGVTVGGGEPTAQADFTREFLSLCRSRNFHTAMETTAVGAWDELAPILACLDLVYIDLKHMDAERHRAWTGVSNGRILENIARAAEVVPLVVRVPVVPGFNDAIENILETAKFAARIGNRFLRLELLPYHQFGVHKYEELDRDYALASTVPPSEEAVMALRDAAWSVGIDVEIGG